MAAYLNHIACAVPPHERQQSFIDSLSTWAGPGEIVEKLRQIVAGAQIERRYSVLAEPFGPSGFYQPNSFPTTGERMQVYRREAPVLASSALKALRQESDNLTGVTHLIVTSCTGFYAPGLDIDIVREQALSPTVQRTV